MVRQGVITASKLFAMQLGVHVFKMCVWGAVAYDIGSQVDDSELDVLDNSGTTIGDEAALHGKSLNALHGLAFSFCHRCMCHLVCGHASSHLQQVLPVWGGVCSLCLS